MRSPAGRAFAHKSMSILPMSILCGIACASDAFARDLASDPKHVVLVVWDGMRPDFVSETNSPTLWKLARDGVVFRNHHSVYPSATNVNGTFLSTPGLWIGLVFAAAFIAAAVRLRRYRGPI